MAGTVLPQALQRDTDGQSRLRGTLQGLRHQWRGRCERKDLGQAIKRMLDSDEAYLLNVCIQPYNMVFPMTPAGSNVDNIMLNATEHYI